MLFGDSLRGPCAGDVDLFFGTVDDGRMEPGREDREAIATAICFSCIHRVRCLERALVLREPYGVWGGMGEGERRKFAGHLKVEGYGNEVPTGSDLRAAVNVWYRINPREGDEGDAEATAEDCGTGLVAHFPRAGRYQEEPARLHA